MAIGKKDEIVLGLDPGSRTTGYAIVSFSGNTRTVLACDVLRLEKFEEHQDRLKELFLQIQQLIHVYKPTTAAVETPVYGKDPLAMLKLGRAQAACMLAPKLEGLQIAEYYPKAVKKAITGNGNASKQQVATMLEHMTGLDFNSLKMDATDALSVAIAHYISISKPQLISVPKKKSHQNRAVSSWEDFVKQNPDRIK
ncbi:crossover junction endodeoxyribonuclease RuvC [bacterium]|nr:MAG: crossover junction endodeoxyribonuclease RuvC [bacterium]